MKKRKKLQPAGVPAVASEVIIATQSLFLFLFGFAAVLATSSVIAGFNALQKLDSSVMLSQGEILSENGVVDTNKVRGIINNFELVGTVIMVFGGIVCIATAMRIYKKSRNSFTGRIRLKR